MAKPKHPLLSLDASGTIGRALTFLKRRGTKIAEITPLVPDAKTLTQLSWRHMYQKCAALWHTLSEAEKQDWNALGGVRHMTGFAFWQSQCLRPNPGIYLPLQGGTMQGDIDMASNKITGLPVPIQPHHAATKAYVDAFPIRPGEGHVEIIPPAYSSIGQGVWTGILWNQCWNFHYWGNTSQADGDNISWKAFLAAGTYTLTLVTAKGTTRAIMDIYIDAAEVASWDLYAAVATPNIVLTQTGIVLANSGIKTIKVEADGKNPLSTAFRVSIQYLVLWRTA